MAYISVLAAANRFGREAVRMVADDADVVATVPERRIRTKGFRNCLDPSGPVPVILLSRGRSGTGSMWQILGSLTGKETPSDEYTGSNKRKSDAFFHNVGPYDGGKWILDVMCYYQRKYKRAKIVGFKWKPFREAFFSPASRNGLELIAKLANENGARSLKVIRSRRNPLDVLISQTKHELYGKSKVAAHCVKGDDECLRMQLQAGTGVKLRPNAVKLLREASQLEEDVNNELRKHGIPFIETSFERTHQEGDEAAEEWMRIFRFLGIGPKEGLIAQNLSTSMQHVSTSHKRHNETIANYGEIRDTLVRTEFEDLLH
eukprot:CAMPEP_0113543434 /NCGR_PEP_ID=MMETSP0015_2-20120614/10156_1 /TAXON_ID=2838 /ORGANISM="Odontella" /LENGTH=316 /DNA_ID=CAMNT_0000443593 /DNA_START=247 /DNA_END=1197 /DNA_ORIENTATION=+ /assembly_acc=CAM_ASM_000160